MSHLTLISSNKTSARNESFSEIDIVEQLAELSATAERISNKLAEIHSRPLISFWQIVFLCIGGLFLML